VACKLEMFYPIVEKNGTKFLLYGKLSMISYYFLSFYFTPLGRAQLALVSI
jgi:hypothetical protein